MNYKNLIKNIIATLTEDEIQNCECAGHLVTNNLRCTAAYVKKSNTVFVTYTGDFGRYHSNVLHSFEQVYGVKIYAVKVGC